MLAGLVVIGLDKAPQGFEQLRGHLAVPPVVRAADLTTRRAVVLVVEWRNFVRLEREPAIISDHDADDAARAFLDAVPLRVFGRLRFPSVHRPRHAAIAGDRVGIGRKRSLPKKIGRAHV